MPTWHNGHYTLVKSCMLCRSPRRPTGGLQAKVFQEKFFIYLSWMSIYYVLGSGALKMNMIHSCYWEVSLVETTTHENKCSPQWTGLSLGHRHRAMKPWRVETLPGHLGSPSGNHIKWLSCFLLLPHLGCFRGLI